LGETKVRELRQLCKGKVHASINAPRAENSGEKKSRGRPRRGNKAHKTASLGGSLFVKTVKEMGKRAAAQGDVKYVNASVKIRRTSTVGMPALKNRSEKNTFGISQLAQGRGKTRRGGRVVDGKRAVKAKPARGNEADDSGRPGPGGPSARGKAQL